MIWSEHDDKPNLFCSRDFSMSQVHFIMSQRPFKLRNIAWMFLIYVKRCYLFVVSESQFPTFCYLVTSISSYSLLSKYVCLTSYSTTVPYFILIYIKLHSRIEVYQLSERERERKTHTHIYTERKRHERWKVEWGLKTVCFLIQVRSRNVRVFVTQLLISKRLLRNK